MNQKLITFLLDPASYPHRPSRVDLVQTHASLVFIAGREVYKVKKPVDFGFLDFSTLAKRRHFCEREVLLNGRLSPEMYLGVVPISRRGGQLGFGKGERVVEYAVRMKKLSQGGCLDRLVDAGRIGKVELDRVAAKLREFYLAQHPTPEVEEWGRIDRLQISTDENFRQTEAYIGQTISAPVFRAIENYTNSFYRRHARDFKARVREGRIRDCHGDLHLEHVHLTARALHIFDCIEFNDRFRYVDVANDIAFLAMDLDHHERPDLARYFAERMETELDDQGIATLFDFYKCYRAYVRGKVESFESAAPQISEAERAGCVRRARQYFQLALRYAVAGSGTPVLVVMGRVGSGKSSLATELSRELGWTVYSSDRIRKELAGVPLTKRGDARARRRLYSPTMTRRTYEALFVAAESELTAGRGVILDATFSRAIHREHVIRRLRGPTLFMEAHAPDRTIRKRLRERDHAGDEISDARHEDFASLSAAYETPDELPPDQLLRISSGDPWEEVLPRALNALVRKHLSRPAGSSSKKQFRRVAEQDSQS